MLLFDCWKRRQSVYARKFLLNKSIIINKVSVRKTNKKKISENNNGNSNSNSNTSGYHYMWCVKLNVALRSGYRLAWPRFSCVISFFFLVISQFTFGIKFSYLKVSYQICFSLSLRKRHDVHVCDTYIFRRLFRIFRFSSIFFLLCDPEVKKVVLHVRHILFIDWHRISIHV